MACSYEFSGVRETSNSWASAPPEFADFRALFLIDNPPVDLGDCGHS